MKRLKEVDFDKRYTLNTKLKSEKLDEGKFETFGKDLETVLSQDPKNVWTCVETEEGLCFVAGLHYVNRIYYLVSNESWTNSDEIYLIEEN